MIENNPRQLLDGPPIPEMREAILTEDDVRELVADLQAHTRVSGTLCKAAAQRQTPPHNIPLEVAVEQLLARTVAAIQIRYEFNGYDWTDTLLHTAAGLRLVRCQHMAAEVATARVQH